MFEVQKPLDLLWLAHLNGGLIGNISHSCKVKCSHLNFCQERKFFFSSQDLPICRIYITGWNFNPLLTSMILPSSRLTCLRTFVLVFCHFTWKMKEEFLKVFQGVNQSHQCISNHWDKASAFVLRLVVVI